MKISNLNVTRDFFNVRDVVSSYRIIKEKGSPFEVYNVCSSKEIRIKDILELLCQITRKVL